MKLIKLFTATVFLLGLITTPTLAAPDSDPFTKGMTPILEAYLKLQQSLAEDSLNGVAESARAIATNAGKLNTKALPEGEATQLRGFPASLKQAAGELEKAADIKKARELFKKISESMILWAKVKRPAGIQVTSCSMANAKWLQRQGDIRNPYYGKGMLECGEIENEPTK